MAAPVDDALAVLNGVVEIPAATFNNQHGLATPCHVFGNNCAGGAGARDDRIVSRRVQFL